MNKMFMTGFLGGFITIILLLYNRNDKDKAYFSEK